MHRERRLSSTCKDVPKPSWLSLSRSRPIRGIAKVELLAGNVHFVSRLIESRVKCIALDMPETNEEGVYRGEAARCNAGSDRPRKSDAGHGTDLRSESGIVRRSTQLFRASDLLKEWQDKTIEALYQIRHLHA